jgi:hypothetical protein
MTSKNVPENLTQTQIDLNSRIFDLILGRALKRVYLEFDEKTKQSVKELTTLSKGKKPTKKYMPDLKALFEQEAQNIEKEIKEKIEKQF